MGMVPRDPPGTPHTHGICWEKGESAPPQHPPFLLSTPAARRRGALTTPLVAISSKARAMEKVGGSAMPAAEARCLQPSSASEKSWKK